MALTTDSYDQSFKLADKVLYLVKLAGENQGLVQ
jgi:hypothetical protein